MGPNSNSTTNANLSQVGFDLTSFYATLTSCFFTIACGYLSIRLKMVSKTDYIGLKFLLLYILTPATFINSLINIQPSTLDWNFVSAIFTAKMAVFCAVAAVTMCLSQNLAKAGLYGIFATQSNDLALGIPIVNSLYGSVQAAHLVDYIYIVIPMALIFHPVAFGMMEIQKQLQSKQNVIPSSAQFAWAVTKGLSKNPILMAVLLGAGGNFVSRSHALPPVLLRILSDLSSAFTVTALFTLGTAVASNRAKYNRQYHAATPIMLVLAKILLVPILIRLLCHVLPVGQTGAEHELLASFGFLYGCLPPAPSVFVYAYYADVGIDQVSSSLALGTFLSAPWLFMTSHMISVSHLSSAQVLDTLNYLRADLSLVSAVFALITILSILIGKKRWCLPRMLVSVYCLSVIINGVGVTFNAGRLSIYATNHSSTIQKVLVYGQSALWINSSILAYSVFAVRAISLCHLIKWKRKLITTMILLPLALVLLNWLVGSSIWPSFLLQLSSIAICVYLLVQQQSAGARFEPLNSEPMPDDLSTGPTSKVLNLIKSAKVPCPATDRMMIPDIEEMVPTDPEHEDEEDVIDNGGNRSIKDLLIKSNQSIDKEDRRLCAKSTYCRGRSKCRALLASYDLHGGRDEQEQPNLDLDRVVLLVCASCVAMLVNLFCSIWALIDKNQDSGVYWQMSFLNTLLTQSQGVIVWLIFGVRLDVLIAGLQRAYRKFRYDSEQLRLPAYAELDEPTRLVCETFITNHLQRCTEQLASQNRQKPSSSQTQTTTRAIPAHLFTGEQFTDWLLDQRLANQREAAVKFGRRLVLGGIVTHVRRIEHFHDSEMYLYGFDAMAGEKFRKNPEQSGSNSEEDDENDADDIINLADLAFSRDRNRLPSNSSATLVNLEEEF